MLYDKIEYLESLIKEINNTEGIVEPVLYYNCVDKINYYYDNENCVDYDIRRCKEALLDVYLRDE